MSKKSQSRDRQTTQKTRGKTAKKKDYTHIETIAVENIEAILEYLGIEYENRYSYFTFPCPIHDGENNTGCSFSLDRKMWKCWSTDNDCNEDYPNNIFGLVMGACKVGFYEAVSIICGVLKISDSDIPEIDVEKLETEKFCKVKKSKNTNNKKTVYDKSCLSKLSSDVYFTKRGFTKKTLDHFQCGFAHKGKMARRIVFPIVDMNDDIVAFSGRIIYECCPKCKKYHEHEDCENTGFSTDSKWKHSHSLSKAVVIYNLNRAYDEIMRRKELIIVEGIPDVMKLYQVGVKNVVCVLGASISQNQLKLLLSIGYIAKVFLFTDSDAAGSNFKNKHSSYDEEDFSSLSTFFYVEKVSLDGYKDIGDMDDTKATEFCERMGWL